MPPETDDAEFEWRRVSSHCGAVGAGLGVLGLLSWVINQPVVSSFSFQCVPMSPREGLAFVLLGLALCMHVAEHATRVTKFFAAGMAVLVLGFGTMSLAQMLASAGSSSFEFRPPAAFNDAVVRRVPRMASLGFMLTAGGLLSLSFGRRRFEWATPWLGLTVAGGGFVIAMGYLYGPSVVYGGQVPVALSGAIAFVSLGVGLVAASGPQLLPQRMLVGTSVRSRLLRRFLPITFFTVLFVEMSSDLLRSYGSGNPAFQAVIQTLVATTLVTLLIFQVARKIGDALDRAQTMRNQVEAKIHNANAELERRVEERTAQLTRVNAGLENEILERRRAEEHLRESEQRFRQLAENIGEVFWASDPGKEQMLYVSPCYEKIWGRTCESLYASPRDWLDAIHAEDRDRVLEAALKKQIPGDYDEVYRIVRPDGSLRWIHDRAFPVRDEAGNVYRIVGIAEDITARKSAQAQLATLGLAVESTSELICITDLEDRFIFVNRAFQQAYGYTEQEILGRTPDILFSPNNAPNLMSEILEQTRRGGWRGEVIDRRKDGTEFPIFLSTSLVKDAEDKIVGLIGVARDIRERKKSEALLRESEEKFRELFESAPIAIALQADNGKILHTNSSYQRMLGYTDAELQQLGVRRITHPDDVAAGQRFFAELVNGKRDRYEREKRYLHKDGHIVWGQSAAAGVRNKQGQLQFIISMVEDITERRAAAEALRESERRLRLIAENTTDVIFAFDMNRQPLYINSAVEKLTGYTFAEIAEHKFINWIHADDQERMLKLWNQLYEGQSYSDVEFRLVNKTGEVKWCASTWGPIRDEQGRQIGVQGREQDITQRKELEHQVLDIGANERRRIGHDLHDGLGQWLAGIALKTKTLEENLGEEGSPQAALAKDIVALLNNAIGQTRSLAYHFDPVQVEADGLVAALGKLTRICAGIFGRECVFHCDKERITVNAQAGQTLFRITQEAIRNAVEHGKAQRIEVTLEADDSQLCLRISDNGSGFTPQPGANSGMGMHIMRFRSNSIRGNLRITSQPGQGTLIECLAPMQACLNRET